VPGGQSACSPRTVRYSGSLLEVLFAFSDSPRLKAGRSEVRVRTVRDSRPDSPRGPCGQSAPPGRTVCQSLAAFSLVRFLLHFFRASVRASRNCSSDLRLIHNLVVWRLVCDSIHRSCVTGICLGYRPGSLRRIFTSSYSLPPSLVVIRSFSMIHGARATAPGRASRTCRADRTWWFGRA
jgi:hypothetical protein